MRAMPIMTALLLGLLTGPATADDGRDLSVTAAPYHLFWPMLHATSELRLGRSTSVAALTGLGWFSGATVLETGLEARLYPTEAGSFAGGLFVGLCASHVAIFYADAAATEPSDSASARSAVAWSPFAGYLEVARVRGRNAAYAGGMLGYKGVWDAGFTLEGSLRLVHYRVIGDAIAGAARRDPFDPPVAPIFALSAGWSFAL